MDFSYQADDNEHSDPKSEFSPNHTASIIKAASAYFDSDTQRSLHFIATIYEVMDSIHLFSQKNTVSAFSFSIKNVDFEGMLKGIRPMCNDHERPFVDKFINIFNMRRMFETYQMMSSMMSMFNSEPSNNSTMNTNSTENNSPSNTDENTHSDQSNYEDNFRYHENLDNPEDFNYQSNFNYQNDFNYEDDFNYENNSNTMHYEHIPDYLEAAQINEPNDYVSNSFDDKNIINKDNININENFKGNQNFINDEKNEHANTNSSESSAPTSNQQMMDMLGSMLTPEQKNTFDSMKMLFDSGMFRT